MIVIHKVNGIVDADPDGNRCHQTGYHIEVNTGESHNAKVHQNGNAEWNRTDKPCKRRTVIQGQNAKHNHNGKQQTGYLTTDNHRGHCSFKLPKAGGFQRVAFGKMLLRILHRSIDNRFYLTGVVNAHHYLHTGL